MSSISCRVRAVWGENPNRYFVVMLQWAPIKLQDSPWAYVCFTAQPRQDVRDLVEELKLKHRTSKSRLATTRDGLEGKLGATKRFDTPLIAALRIRNIVVRDSHARDKTLPLLSQS